MTIKIVTDSACDLPAEFLKTYPVQIVPLFINIGEKSYLDGIEMTHQQFYAGLPGFKEHPFTAAPGPAAFQKVYEQAASAGDQVLAIHVASSLSAVINSALASAKQASIPVHVYDSGQLALAAGLQVMAAAKAAAEGLGLAEILDRLRSLADRTHIFAVLDTMKYLERSGRINLASAGLGALLRIKPILKMHRNLATTEKVSTHLRAVRRLVHLVEELGPLEHLSMVHTNALQSARKLYEKARDLVPTGNQPFFQSATPVIGAHVGPGVIGFVCVRK